VVEGTKNNHFQGWFKLKRKNRARLSAIIKKLPAALKGIHIRPCSVPGVHSLPAYCQKPETHVMGPWGIEKAPIECKELGIFDKKDWKPWMNIVYDIYKGPPHKREIVWVYDQLGGKGKSTFVNHFIYKEKDTLVLPWIGVTDAAAILSKQRSKRCFIFSLPRGKSNVKMDDFISLLEQLKEGYIVTTKYIGEPIKFGFKPHVFVLGNFKPPWEKMTDGRFYVMDLGQPNTPWYCDKLHVPEDNPTMEALRNYTMKRDD